MAALERERKFLISHKDELLRQYGGKFLVISGEQVTGAYDTIEEALQNAATQHGLANVLIRRPADADLVISAPALSLGILNADPARSTGGTGTNSGR
ncbi:MAG TPA: hypothetical protein VEK33_25860 [Terriglobales bacterium]|nr:hypothetical protein [Terriglobales bacterium]